MWIASAAVTTHFLLYAGQTDGSRSRERRERGGQGEREGRESLVNTNWQFSGLLMAQHGECATLRGFSERGSN